MRNKLIIVFAVIALGLVGCSKSDDTSVTTAAANATATQDQGQITPATVTETPAANATVGEPANQTMQNATNSTDVVNIPAPVATPGANGTAMVPANQAEVNATTSNATTNSMVNATGTSVSDTSNQTPVAPPSALPSNMTAPMAAPQQPGVGAVNNTTGAVPTVVPHTATDTMVNNAKPTTTVVDATQVPDVNAGAAKIKTAYKTAVSDSAETASVGKDSSTDLADIDTSSSDGSEAAMSDDGTSPVDAD